MLLGELGGLFGIISAIPAILISRIAENQFNSAVAERLIHKIEAPNSRTSQELVGRVQRAWVHQDG